MVQLKKQLVGIATAFILTLGVSSGASAKATGEIYEARLMDVLELVRSSNLGAALAQVESLLKDYPTSRVGHLLQGDLLMAYANPVSQLAGPFRKLSESTVSALQEELNVRWQHNQTQVPAHNDMFPATLVRPAPSHEYLIYVDLTKSRLYIYRNTDSVPTLVKDYYVTMGLNGTRKIKQGDQKTPIGVYYVTNYIPGDDLPDRYGLGAFPINYPNEIDQRYSRSGYGIWLHGTTQSTYNRPPKDSDGCVVLSNDDFSGLYPFIEADGLTPVIIADEPDWVGVNELLDRRRLYSSLVEQWRRDWESLDNKRYLQHYSKTKFSSGEKDYPAWATYKTKINQGKEYVEINLRDLSIFEYPGEQDTFVVNFDQEYRSNNYYGVTRKRQYWSKEQDTGQWRIIYEGRG